MSEPPQQPMTMERRYRFDAEYTADAASLEAAGWRLIVVQRAPDNSIVARYAFGEYTPAPPTQPHYTSHAASIGVLLAGLIIILCVGIVVVSVSGGLFRSPSACTANSGSCSASNVTPTTTPVCGTATPTTTPLAADTTSVKLGDLYDAFGARFGCEDPSGGWYNVNYYGQIVTIEVGDSQSTTMSGLASSDGRDRVFFISVTWYENSLPNLASKRALVAHFFPPDSVSLGANSKVTPTEYLYRSATLATTFKSSSFMNNAYQLVTPGTFSEMCDAVNCTVQIGDWNYG